MTAFCDLGQETYRIVSFLIGQFVDCVTPGLSTNPYYTAEVCGGNYNQSPNLERIDLVVYKFVQGVNETVRSGVVYLELGIYAVACFDHKLR